MRWKIFQWVKFLFRHSSNSRKLSRQKFYNELAYVFTAHDASKNADRNQQQLTDSGILTNWNSSNHPYCLRSNQKKVQILAFFFFVSWEGSGFNSKFCTQTSHVDHDNLRKLDVLGLVDTSTGDQAEIYAEFKEQLTQDAEGWYETGLPWRGNHPPLPSNEVGSIRRLGNLVRKLRSQGTIERYNQVIQDEIEAGIVERVSGPVTGNREFYIPHKPVVRESAETTKLRVVYDASARAHSGAPSLNECLNPGPRALILGSTTSPGKLRREVRRDCS